MCLKEAKEMGHGYSLLCQGMIPLQSFLKCFYSGGTCAKHRTGVISKSCCLEKSPICNGQNSINRYSHNDEDVHLHSTTSSVCLKQPETLEKIEEGSDDAIPSEEEIHRENVAAVQLDTEQPTRVFRPPIMAALKSNAYFNSPLEGADLDPVPNESTKNLHNKATVKAAFQNHKELPGKKTQRVVPSTYVTSSTVLRIETDVGTPSPKRCHAGIPIETLCKLTRRADQDVEAGNAQNLRDTESDARCRQQRSLVRQNLLCIGSQDMPETLHVGVGDVVHCRNSTSFLANGSVFTVITDHYTPPMDGILGSLGRSNRLKIEAQLQQNGDVRCSKSGGTLPTSNVIPSAGKVIPSVGKVEDKPVKDGKMRWQESVTSVSKNLRVIIDELHKPLVIRWKFILMRFIITRILI